MIDNLVHIAHNVFLGDNACIAAQSGISGSTSIGKFNFWWSIRFCWSY